MNVVPDLSQIHYEIRRSPIGTSVYDLRRRVGPPSDDILANKEQSLADRLSADEAALLTCHYATGDPDLAHLLAPRLATTINLHFPTAVDDPRPLVRSAETIVRSSRRLEINGKRISDLRYELLGGYCWLQLAGAGSASFCLDLRNKTTRLGLLPPDPASPQELLARHAMLEIAERLELAPRDHRGLIDSVDVAEGGFYLPAPAIGRVLVPELFVAAARTPAQQR